MNWLLTFKGNGLIMDMSRINIGHAFLLPNLYLTSYHSTPGKTWPVNPRQINKPQFFRGLFLFPRNRRSRQAIQRSTASSQQDRSLSCQLLASLPQRPTTGKLQNKQLINWTRNGRSSLVPSGWNVKLWPSRRAARSAGASGIRARFAMSAKGAGDDCYRLARSIRYRANRGGGILRHSVTF